ncbi:hypothetical protein MCELHM10_01333 [Paracoccaceae bacterium]
MTSPRIAGLLALALVAAFAAYVRFAPVDPERWHVDLRKMAATLAHVSPSAKFTGPNSVVRRLDGPADTLQELLTMFDLIAVSSDRTRRIAGSVKEGWVTWETRSLIWGFPDYTTAQILDDQTLVLFGRSRFGGRDWGANAARLEGWFLHL